MPIYVENQKEIGDGTAFYEPGRGQLYTLSHTYDRFLATSHHYHGKNRRKKNWTTSGRDQNVKANTVRLWLI